MANVSFVKTKTRENDTWDTLFARYKGAFPSGTTVAQFAKAVASANGVAYTTNAVEKWIFGLSGKRFAYDPKNNPGMYGGPKGVGWSYFGQGNEVLLPDVSEPTTTAPVEVSQPALVVKDNRVMLWMLFGAGALWAAALLLGDDKKQKGER